MLDELEEFIVSSQALARKYRPQEFDGVVGQETTVQILKNALSQNRLHHAYLFTGPRGIGKTTLARIFAKALNCQKGEGPATNPCDECSSCKEITEGRSLSVQEIDGASNTSVEDVRDLREKIRYLPPGGRYKIYIIDEVHMLSTAAFNALLKTLEEPPPHVLFLFATTDPQKVPATVLSRVIRFDLRPILRASIVTQLKKIIAAEKIQASDDALFQIAREAEGGLRDALSLLDQVIAYSHTALTGSGHASVTLDMVEAVVGVSTRRFVKSLSEAVLKKNGPAVLKISEDAFQSGLDTKRLALDLLENFRHLLVAQVSREPSLFDLSQDEIEELAALSQTISASDLDRLFRILQKGILDLIRSPLPKVLLDVLLLRLTNWESLEPLEELLASLKGGGAETRPAVSSAPIRTPPPPPAAGWNEFLRTIREKSPRLAALVEQGSLVSLNPTDVVLRFPQKSMNLELLKEADRDQAFKQLMNDFFKRPLTVRYEVQATGAAPSSGNASVDILDDAISIFGPKTVVSPKRGPT